MILIANLHSAQMWVCLSFTSFVKYGLTVKKVTLPPAFGSAYVGETFACSLCVNNELPETETSKVVSSVRVIAEMQTPSQVMSLDLKPSEDEQFARKEGGGGGGLGQGQSFQKIVQFDLKEEGNHILAVNVSYSETLIADESHAAGGRVRTFRKLYQFIAQPCLSVRTKASELAPLEIDNKTLGPYGKARLLRYALEAQLENVGDGSVVVEVGLYCCIPNMNVMELTVAFIENNAQRKSAFQGANTQLGLATAGQGLGRASGHEPAGHPAGGISD